MTMRDRDHTIGEMLYIMRASMKKLLLIVLTSVVAMPACATIMTFSGNFNGASGVNSIILPTLPEGAKWKDLFIYGSGFGAAEGSVTIANNWCPECGITLVQNLSATLSVGNINHSIHVESGNDWLVFFQGDAGDSRSYSEIPYPYGVGFTYKFDLNSVTDSQLTLDTNIGITTSLGQIFNVTDNGDLQTINPHYRIQYFASYDTLDAVPEPASWVMMIGGFGIIGALLRHPKGVGDRSTPLGDIS